MKKLKVALVHDFLVAFGGAERVLVAFHEIWPEAPVYLAVLDPKGLGRHWQVFKNWNLKTSWFQKIPWARKLISPFRFLLPLIWKSFDFSDYDLVVSSSSWAISKGISVPEKTFHLCYCHTPPRFLYAYPEARKWTKYWLVRAYGAIINHFLRFYDYQTAQKVDLFVANSEEVAQRIKKFYRRNSIVIQPPIEKFKTDLKKKKKSDFYFYSSRLYSYKHPELAIKACQKLGRKLIVAGDGALRKKVEAMAALDPKITYLGWVSDQKLWRLYRDCKALIYPLESEDFGMMPLEAASMGAPTIGYYSGGVKETILEGKTGLFFRQLTVDSLAEAIKKFEKMKFSSLACRKWAQKFSKENFKKRIKSLVDKNLS